MRLLVLLILLFGACTHQKILVIKKQEDLCCLHVPPPIIDEACWKELPNNEPEIVSFQSDTILPQDIPYTSPWVYKGNNLKWHIYVTHGIETERMKLLNHYDLVKLHSYIHNGGRKFGGY